MIRRFFAFRIGAEIGRISRGFSNGHGGGDSLQGAQKMARSPILCIHLQISLFQVSPFQSL